MSSNKDAVYDNFPIKGYSDLLESNINIRTSGDSTALLIYSGGAIGTSLTLRFTGAADQEMGQPVVTWKLAEGGENITRLTTNAEGTKAYLDALAYGKTFLSITVDGVGTKVLPVIVNPAAPSLMLLKDGDTVAYTGKAIKPDAYVYGVHNESLEEGKDFTFSYENNINCGKGFVYATATGNFADGKVPDPAKTAFFITPAQAAVSKLTSGKNTLTVTVKDQYSSGIDGVKVQYRIAGTSAWTTKTLKSGKTSLTLKGLQEGKQYEVRARGFVTIEDAVYYGKYSSITTSDTLQAKDITNLKVSLSCSSTTYSGKEKKPSATIKDGSKTLVKGTDYTIVYAKNKAVGTATVTIKGIGNYKGTVKKTFKIIPKGTSLSSLTAASKAFSAKWKKQTTQTTGYQIQYSLKKDFSSGNKTVTVGKNSVVTKKLGICNLKRPIM